jgi:hypothetical protein
LIAAIVELRKRRGHAPDLIVVESVSAAAEVAALAEIRSAYDLTVLMQVEGGTVPPGGDRVWRADGHLKVEVERGRPQP